MTNSVEPGDRRQRLLELLVQEDVKLFDTIGDIRAEERAGLEPVEADENVLSVIAVYVAACHRLRLRYLAGDQL